MSDYSPQRNVLYGFAAGVISTALLHWAAAIGYDVQPDMASGLPAAISVAIAYGHDCLMAWLAKRDAPK